MKIDNQLLKFWSNVKKLRNYPDNYFILFYLMLFYFILFSAGSFVLEGSVHYAHSSWLQSLYKAFALFITSSYLLFIFPFLQTSVVVTRSNPCLGMTKNVSMNILIHGPLHENFFGIKS